MMAGYRILLGLKRAPGLPISGATAAPAAWASLKLKQRKTVGLQLVQDRHASDEQYQKFQQSGHKAVGLLLVYWPNKIAPTKPIANE